MVRQWVMQPADKNVQLRSLLPETGEWQNGQTFLCSRPVSHLYFLPSLHVLYYRARTSHYVFGSLLILVFFAEAKNIDILGFRLGWLVGFVLGGVWFF